MHIIIHRVNTIQGLRQVPSKYGVEIDIRGGKNGALYLNHEAFGTGDAFDAYLKQYKQGNHRGTMIFNIKESGIESRVIEIASEYGVENYFLLDVEAPYLYRGSREGVRKMAVRYSEVEPIETLEYYRGYVDWVWIDTVSELPLNKRIIEKLNGFKTCLVCPDRWGRPEDISLYRKKMLELGFIPDAVMTATNCLNAWEK